jgi:hypothetical protein
MTAPAPVVTRYGGLSRWQARVVLATTLAFLSSCLGVALVHAQAILPRPPRRGGNPDARLYRLVVERVHAGENYYDAVATELAALDVVPTSFLFWRLPTYAWLLGRLPDPSWGRLLLAGLAFAALLLVYGPLRREAGPVPAFAGVLLMITGFLWCFEGDLCYLQELWAGTLIALSIAAYGHGWRWLGVTAGLAALFFRELALLYVLPAVVLAGWQRHAGELAAWGVGLALFGLLLAFHFVEASRRLLPPEQRLPGPDWLQLGGLTFILTTARLNYFLYAAPPWVTALLLPFSLLGAAGWRSAMGLRIALTLGAFLAAFAVVGLPVNNYWGVIFAPLLPLGLVWAPLALRDLLRAAR